MPLRNRVTPLGELVAVRDRGEVYGNRGCLHDDEGRIRRAYQVKRWIACRLHFRGRRRSPLMQPGRYTELFFLDDATALAAGHRACRECRYEDYQRLAGLFDQKADAIDARLHAERIDPRSGLRRLHLADADDLPDGAFVLVCGAPWLVLGRDVRRWTPAGYTERRPRPAGDITLITPPSLVELLRRGWDPVVPLLHRTAL